MRSRLATSQDGGRQIQLLNETISRNFAVIKLLVRDGAAIVGRWICKRWGRSGRRLGRGWGLGYGVVEAVVEAIVGTTLVGTNEGLASMMIVRVLVAVLPQVSVAVLPQVSMATYSIVSVATCDVSIRMFPDRIPLMKVR